MFDQKKDITPSCNGPYETDIFMLNIPELSSFWSYQLRH